MKGKSIKRFDAAPIDNNLSDLPLIFFVLNLRSKKRCLEVFMNAVGFVSSSFRGFPYPLDRPYPACEIEYTFDSPTHPYSRWGRLITGSWSGVRLEFIGSGKPSEVQGCREYKS